MVINQIIEEIKSGNRVSLGRAITLIESSNDKDQKLAENLVERCMSLSGNSIRIAISGPPGVGKSTFIEKFGIELIKSGHKVAVLAIDPSSKKSGGSILGDKTRMEVLAKDNNAFIRPSPTSDFLGGVHNKTREAILLCEAAGYDRIIIETVGVGQSEVAAYQLTDFFLLLTLAGAGDDLQGIKRGIMELADGIVVNKADGANINLAQRAAQELRNTLHLMPMRDSKQEVHVLTASGLNGSGIDKIISVINDYQAKTVENGFWIQNRNKQKLHWLNDAIQFEINNKYKAILQSAHQSKEWLSGENDSFVHPNKIARKLLEGQA